VEPREILDVTQRLILQYAGDDPDRWWYANRFVFARLQLDERKTKAAIKRDLLRAGLPCHLCGQPFESRRGVHLHRLDGERGYSRDNCVLMHADCHRQYHASREAGATPAGGREPTPTKLSKRYDGKPFLYWWDISPSLADSLEKFDAVEFVKKDTGERCLVSPQVLKRFLVHERRTTRGRGNWGVRVLADRPDELAFEPGTGGGEWLFLPVVWLAEAED